MKRHYFVLALVASLLVAALSGYVIAQGTFVLRVNAGDTAVYTDKAGNAWQPDKLYKKGGKYGFVDGDTIDRGNTLKIQGTNDPKIYQTERYNLSSFVAEVPNGKYTVRLHFAETYENIDTDGPRVFNVNIQGKPALKDFNVQKEAAGVQKAIIKEFKGVEVTNGTLEVKFIALEQNPEINGIEVIAE
jgi:endoglucanase